MNCESLDEVDPVELLLRVLGVPPHPTNIAAIKTKMPQPVRVRQELGRLKGFSCMIGKARAFPSRKGDMPAMTPSLEAVDDIGKPR